MHLSKKTKKVLSVFSAVLFCTMLLTTVHSVSAEVPTSWDKLTDTFKNLDVGNSIKSIFIDLGNYIDKIKLMLVEIIMKISLTAFDPTYNTIIAIDQGKDALSYTADITAGNTTFVTQIHGIAIAAGFFLMTLISSVSLLFCAFGRAQHIKNSVAYILITTLISGFVIYTSGGLISSAIGTVAEIWQQFVVADITGGNMLLNTTTITEKSATIFDIIEIADDAGINAVNITIFGIDSFSVGSPFKLVFSCISFFFVWKLIKGYFSIFMEIVERYMVLMILVLFLPAAIPTIISSGTSNIFKAYLRMFFSEAFLFVINGIFMKVFLYYLIEGGWTAGIMNYLAALGFLKVCSKFDGWLKAIGLNVAQTGGGLLNAMGGSLSRGLMMLSSLASSASRTANSVGGAMMTKALATGDYDMFHRGEMLKGGVINAMMGNQGTTQAGFNAMMAQNAQRELQVGKGFGESMRTTHCNQGGVFDSWMNNSGLSNDTKSSMMSAGIDASSCESINEWKGSGVAAFYDKNGHLMGHVNNGKFVQADQLSSKGEHLHNKVLEKNDSSGRRAAQAMEKPYLPNSEIQKRTGLTSISGTHGAMVNGSDPLKRSHSDGSKVGRQVITGTKLSLQQNGEMKPSMHTYEVYKGSLSPEIVAEYNRGGRFDHIEHDGEDYYMREIKAEKLNDDEPTIVTAEEVSLLDTQGNDDISPASEPDNHDYHDEIDADMFTQALIEDSTVNQTVTEEL